MLIFTSSIAFSSESLNLSDSSQGLISQYVELVNQATDFKLRTDTRKIDLKCCLENYQVMVQTGKMTEAELREEVSGHIEKYQHKIDQYVKNGCVEVSYSMVNLAQRHQKEDQLQKQAYDKQPLVQKIIKNAADLLEKNRLAAAQALQRNGLNVVNDVVDQMTINNAKLFANVGLNAASASVLVAFTRLKHQMQMQIENSKK
jgi:methylthioribose-1-phosphate isomerase